jgi:hypothetical protein
MLEPPAGEKLNYHYTNEEGGQQLRRYWTNACRGCALIRRCRTSVCHQSIRTGQDGLDRTAISSFGRSRARKSNLLARRLHWSGREDLRIPPARFIDAHIYCGSATKGAHNIKTPSRASSARAVFLKRSVEAGVTSRQAAAWRPPPTGEDVPSSPPEERRRGVARSRCATIPPGYTRYAAAFFVDQLNSVPSIHMRCRTTASLRATASPASIALIDSGKGFPCANA